MKRAARTVGDLSEFALIGRETGGASPAPAAGRVLLGVGDDAALLAPPPGAEVVATCDALVEGVHFRRAWSAPGDVGWKALAVNVSDLGAMGAQPLACLLTAALPADLPLRWLDGFYRGLAECAARYGCPLVGGDTVRSPAGIALTVTAFGSVPAGAAVRRSGARAGDLLCVTGVLGSAAGGLAWLQAGRRLVPAARDLVARHQRPAPPVAAGVALREADLPTAMLDLSDGLASDLQRLRDAGGLGAEVDAARLPIADAARQAAARLGAEPVEWALHGGEDFELLFLVPPERFPEVPPILGPLGVTATIIGRIGGRSVRLRRPDGRREPLRPRGFAHFAPG